jgi:hypothetical protein
MKPCAMRASIGGSQFKGCLPVSLRIRGSRGIQASGVSASLASTADAGTCCSHSAVSGSSAGSAGAPPMVSASDSNPAAVMPSARQCDGQLYRGTPVMQTGLFGGVNCSE